jgi:hypothetical protein
VTRPETRILSDYETHHNQRALPRGNRYPNRPILSSTASEDGLASLA